MSDPDVARDPAAYQRLAKESKEIAPIVDRYRAYKGALAELTKVQEMIRAESDPELREMAHEELRALEARRDALDAEIPAAADPQGPQRREERPARDPRGHGRRGGRAVRGRDVPHVLALRGAAALEGRRDLRSTAPARAASRKSIALIEGDRVYSKLRYESGVHRVQRVPATEASGRIHTSAVTVAVLPEAEEVDVKIEAKDLRIDTFCSSGPGGQSVNTTYSAVRITHLPTNTVVSCQDEKSQIKNREKAMKVLRARLYEMALEEQQKAIASDRKSQVGSGDRSEKIRTYNFQQARVTDHRIGLTLHRLQDVLDGDLDEVVQRPGRPQPGREAQAGRRAPVAPPRQRAARSVAGASLTTRRRGPARPGSPAPQAGRRPDAAWTPSCCCATSLGWDRAAILARGREPLPPEAASPASTALVGERARRRPLQHLTGTQAFWRHEFLVTPDVLIPRPETEVLVEAALELLRGVPAPVVVDVGTGSGCIALSLAAERPDAAVHAVDVSARRARGGARERAPARPGRARRVPPGRPARPRWPSLAARVDLVASNPPYVDPADLVRLPARGARPRAAPAAARARRAVRHLPAAGRAGRARCCGPAGALAVEVGPGHGGRGGGALAAARVRAARPRVATCRASTAS